MLFNNNDDELIVLSDALYKIITRQYDESIKILELLSDSNSEIISNLSLYYCIYLHKYQRLSSC